MTLVGHSEKVFFVKIFIVVIILIFSFQSWTHAEDISEFEIDGISVGASALKYFNKKEILKQIDENAYMYDYLKKPKKFGHIVLREGLKEYSFVQMFVSLNNEYTIEGINANIDEDIVSKNDLQNCLKQMKEVEKVFSQIFNKYEKYEGDAEHPIDPSGRSKFYYVKFLFKNGDNAQAQCYDFEEELKKKNNWAEGLTVTVRKKDVSTWLIERK